MRKHLKTLSLGLMLFVAVVASAAALRPGSVGGGNGGHGQGAGKLPVADYSASDAAEQADAKRKTKSARFNKRGAEPITEHPAGVEQLPLISHWWVGLPALPVAQSDAVVVGKITGARAFMSGDKTDVYSEFTVSVEESLKGGAAAGSTLTADRRGGGVRFPSGRVQRHVVANMRLPEVGVRYVLFLKGEGEGYAILTGYELHGSQVSPLDGPDIYDERSKMPFSAYEGKPVAEFLQAVRAAVAREGNGVTADKNHPSPPHAPAPPGGALRPLPRRRAHDPAPTLRPDGLQHPAPAPEGQGLADGPDRQRLR